jgi:hypothetical protein
MCGLSGISSVGVGVGNTGHATEECETRPPRLRSFARPDQGSHLTSLPDKRSRTVLKADPTAIHPHSRGPFAIQGR